MRAASVRITAIIGANLHVIAIERIGASLAPAPAANIVERAGILVVAVHCIGLENAALVRVATVIGTDILVVANRHAGADAVAVQAIIKRSTLIAIITFNGVVSLDTADGWLTAIIGADIQIIA